MVAMRLSGHRETVVLNIILCQWALTVMHVILPPEELQGGRNKGTFWILCRPFDGIYNNSFVILECEETARKIMSAFLHPEVCASRNRGKENKEAKTVRGAWDDGKKTKGYEEMNWTWHETRWQEGSAKEAGKERGTSKEWFLIIRVFSFPGVRLSERLGGICCPTFPLWPYIKPRGK